jgi:peptide/nickel transport system ATP-binding protein
MPLLNVKNLKIYFDTPEGVAHAVDGIDFSVGRNSVVCIVGESGCGKSVTARSIMRIVPTPPGRIANGEINFELDGETVDLARLEVDGKKMRSIRGNQIAMIFQEPMTSLNPAYTIGDQISESIILHQRLKKKAALEKAIQMMTLVGIPAPEKRVHEYPHQFSGGMRQRVMIAIALSCNPSLLIADEPTTALDVTIQAQVLQLINRLRRENAMSVLFITHDLGVVAEIADEVIVMYLGKIVEKGSADDIFFKPSHPYTVGLLKSIPSLETTKSERLTPIEGTVPSSISPPVGCRFADRCVQSEERCFQTPPPEKLLSRTHLVRCWLFVDTGGQETR